MFETTKSLQLKGTLERKKETNKATLIALFSPQVSLKKKKKN